MSVEKRKGTPFYWYDFRYQGQRYRGSTQETDKRKAEQAERAERQAVIDGKRNVAGHSVADLFAKYWTAHGKKLKWAPTLEKHMDGLEAFFGATTRFVDITTKDVSAALDAYAAQTERKNRGQQTVRPGSPSDTTVNRRLAAFRQIYLKVRDEWEMPVGHVNFKVLVRKEPRERNRHLSSDQAHLVISTMHARWPETALVLVWSLMTGCRKNETKTLVWDRVNYDTLQAEVVAKGGGTRFVELTPQALAVLDQCPQKRRYCFDMTNLRKRYDAILKECGIEDFRYHDLRHTFATWLANACGDITVVQKALGHGQLSTTERYRHVIRGQVRASASKLPVLIEGAQIIPLMRKGEKGGA